MTRRHLVLGLLLAAIALSLKPVAAGAQAMPAPPTPISRFGGCLAAQKEGDLLLLIDESGSLKDSDPSGSRVVAAQYLLRRLQAFTERTQTKLNVGIAGFSHNYSPALDWTTLDADNAARISGVLESFRTRVQGQETDYWTALNGARGSLVARGPGANDSKRCQAIAWFSDGALDIIPRASDKRKADALGGSRKEFAEDINLTNEAAAAEAEKRAAQQLCRPTGLSDQIRSEGVVIFAIGLAGPKGASPEAFALMRQVATSEGNCGAITTPPPGEFRLANDLDGLLLAFDQISTPDQPAIQKEAPICQNPDCPDHHRFVLDASIGQVHVLGNADLTTVKVYLRGPNGEPVELVRKSVGAKETITVGGVPITYMWPSDRTVEFDMTKGADSSAWTGAWAISFVDPAAGPSGGKSRSNIHISSDLRPGWTAPKKPLYSGERIPEAMLQVLNGQGQVVDPGQILGQLRLDATLVGEDRTEVPVASADVAGLTKPFDLDLTKLKPGPAVLRLQLNLTTAGPMGPDAKPESGTALKPQSAEIPIVVLPPVNYPKVSDKLDYGRIETRAGLDKTAGLKVSGPGCVWLEPAAPKLTGAPSDLGKVTVESGRHSSRATCLQVREGATAEFPVTLKTEAGGNGGLSGVVKVMTGPIDDQDKGVPVDVRFSGDIKKPLEKFNFITALVAGTVLGPGIPLLLLYLLKALTAKIPSRVMFGQLVPVTVDNGVVNRDGVPLALGTGDLTSMVSPRSGGARSLKVDSAELRTKVGWSPFGSGYVVGVLGQPPLPGAGSENPASSGKRHLPRLPLAVHNKWMVFHDPKGPANSAHLLLLVGTGQGDQQRKDLIERIHRQLPHLLDLVRGSAGASTAPSSLDGDGQADLFMGASEEPDPFADPFGTGCSSDPFGEAPDPFGTAAPVPNAKSGLNSRPKPAATPDSSSERAASAPATGKGDPWDFSAIGGPAVGPQPVSEATGQTPAPGTSCGPDPSQPEKKEPAPPDDFDFF